MDTDTEDSIDEPKIFRYFGKDGLKFRPRLIILDCDEILDVMRNVDIINGYLEFGINLKDHRRVVTKIYDLVNKKYKISREALREEKELTPEETNYYLLRAWVECQPRWSKVMYEGESFTEYMSKVRDSEKNWLKKLPLSSGRSK